MTWKPVSEQWVLARLDGKVREVLVTAWESYSGAVRVAWPLETPAHASRDPYSRRARSTAIDQAAYEPLDPEAFKIATQG